MKIQWKTCRFTTVGNVLARQELLMETTSLKGNQFYLPITPSRSSRTLVRADRRAGAMCATQWNL